MKYKGPSPNEELFDLNKDPNQFFNLVSNPEYQVVLDEMRLAFTNKMKELIINDLK